MVTRESKQQQQLPPRHQHERQQVVVVTDKDNWNGENNEITEYNRRCAISDECLMTSNLTTDNLKINKNKENFNNRVSQVNTLYEKETTRLPSKLLGKEGNNGENAANSNEKSTPRSDIEEDNDVETEVEIEGEEDDYEVEVNSDREEREDDREVKNRIEKSDNWMKKKKVTTTKVRHQTSFSGNDDRPVMIPNLDETTFGEVCITNSEHVHVGNTNFYKGPVTIKQFVYTNAYPVVEKEENQGSSRARVAADINPNNVQIVKCDPDGPILPSYGDYDNVTKWLWTWRCAAILCVLALSLVTVVAVSSVLLTRNADLSRLPNKLPDSPNSGSDENDLPGNSVRIIEREFWNAQPPSKDLEKLEESPTPYVIISHTATVPCLTQSACVLRVRLIQTLHIESFGWDDIGYNFLIGGDGLAYRGRGWDHAGAHAFGYNFNSIGISFIGTFNDVTPSKLQIQAAQKLIELGVNISKISRSYKLLGHRQVSKTLSPGEQLYKILQTWDHWSPLPRPEENRASTTDRPHLAVVLPLIIIIIIPHLSAIVQRSSRILFPGLLVILH